MDENEIRALVLQALDEVAPGVDKSGLRPEQPLRAQIDLDSMDWLNCLAELGGRLKIEIPEADYGRLGTLEALVSYLKERLS
ncbi:MAG: acyl carrier protein [Betaproteobacteria bacterium]|nr:acyl carrier protein [Betaproteobacteria bacterium]MBI2960500.1 acyl carrier protein [Betaproteobacteria bacterium]